MEEITPPFEDDAPQEKVSAEKIPKITLLLQQKRLHYLPILILAVLIVVLVIVFVDKPSDFEDYIKKSGYYGVLLMAIIGSASPIWPLPGSWAAFIAGGLGLNPLLVALAAGFGEPVGETTAYMAGYGGQAAITNWKKYDRVESWMTRHGAITLFLLSAIPNTFTKVAVIAAGALRYPWWKFFVVCWAGKTIKSFGFAICGYFFFDALFDTFDRIF